MGLLRILWSRDCDKIHQEKEDNSTEPFLVAQPSLTTLATNAEDELAHPASLRDSHTQGISLVNFAEVFCRGAAVHSPPFSVKTFVPVRALVGYLDESHTVL